MSESCKTTEAHAEWKICPDGYYPYCSRCKEEPENDTVSKYCPNCGAKMDLGDLKDTVYAVDLDQSREILFRGKRKDNKEWVYGIPIVMHHNDERTHLHYFIIPDGSDLSFGVKVEDILVEIIPETRDQYTGLHDNTHWDDLSEEEKEDWLKHHTKDEWIGTKIFEGDIIKVDDGAETKQIVVEFGKFEPTTFYDCIESEWGERPEELYFGLYGEVITKGKENVLITDKSDFLEIIGNIYDTPELLEVEK